MSETATLLEVSPEVTKTAEVTTYGREVVGEIDLFLHVCAHRVEDQEDGEAVFGLFPTSEITVLLLQQKSAQLITVHSDNKDKVMRADTNSDSLGSYITRRSSKSHQLLARTLLFLHAFTYADFEKLEGCLRETVSFIEQESASPDGASNRLEGREAVMEEWRFQLKTPPEKVVPEQLQEPMVNLQVSQILEIDTVRGCVVVAVVLKYQREAKKATMLVKVGSADGRVESVVTVI
ncbi:unnamed protein product [Amoebophrya sp. A120]|nr:unnamed protein product [Amoebophrya sp. A120]|eukprot:GSA120T00020479001.1